jgi:NhaP-type Na+/H+ or K+/H+ antiporter
MFLLAHSLHLSGPLAVLLSIAMIALRVFMRSSRGSRGRRR